MEYEHPLFLNRTFPLPLCLSTAFVERNLFIHSVRKTTAHGHCSDILTRVVWTCRRGKQSANKNSIRGTRSRSAKRTALYDAMAQFASHFRPLLQAELQAEQAAFCAYRAERAAAKDDVVNNLVASRKQRLFSSEVYALSPRSSKSSVILAPYRAFSKGDLIDLAPSGSTPDASDGEDGDTVQGIVLSRSLNQLLVAFPLGTDAMRRMQSFTETGVALRAQSGTNAVAFERAMKAVDAFVTTGSGTPELTRLLVMSFSDLMSRIASSGHSLMARSRDPRETLLSPVGKRDDGIDGGKFVDNEQWNALACENVSSADTNAMNNVINRLPKYLNESQRAAVRNALQRRLTLVQGPPGTGKTVTAAHIIRSALCIGIRRVLVVAASNVAVDNVLRKTVAVCKSSSSLGGVEGRWRMVRVGRAAGVADDLWEYCLDALVERDRRMRKAREDLRNGYVHGTTVEALTRRVEESVVEEADVIFATCVGSGATCITDLPFGLVVMDEAAQMTTPDMLIALAGDGRGEAIRQVVLVGDPQQLGPTVISEAVGLNGVGLGLSAFEQLVLCGVSGCLLNRQYRMHGDVSHFPNRRFYGGRVRDGVTERERGLRVGVARRLRMGLGAEGKWNGERVVFLDVGDGVEEVEGNGQNSLMNRREAQIVLWLLRVVAGQDGEGVEDIGVISPYAAQVRLLEGMVRGVQALRDVEVNTVDGFQGREKDVVVLSAVRSNEAAGVGFLADWRRLNVAMTRSRVLLMVVADGRTVRRDPNWAAWLAWVRRHGFVLRSSAVGDLPRLMGTFATSSMDTEVA